MSVAAASPVDVVEVVGRFPLSSSILRPMMTSDRTLRSAAPVPGDGDTDRPPEAAFVLAGGTLVELHPPRIEHADVLVRGDAIAQIGGPMPEGATRIDVSGCLVTPAFAVAHSHLYMSLTCGMPPPPSAPHAVSWSARSASSISR